MTASEEQAIAEAATQWWQKRGEGGAASRAAFADWLSADPRHGAAFDAVEAAWDAFGDVGEDPESGSTLDETDLMRTLNGVRDNQRRQVPTIARRGLIAAGIAASVAGGAFWISQSRKVTTEFTTGPGQHLRQVLADGSALDLDANSHVRITYSNQARDVALLRGRVLFDVTHNPQRPFVVQTQNGSVTVLGTMFSVEYRDQATSVTLLRGRVRAAALTGERSNFEMVPGDAVLISEDGTVKVSHHVDVVRAAMWREGRLVFDDQSLDQVVSRMNDYSQDHISIRDARAAALRVNGIFQAGGTDAFLKALKAYYGLSVERSGHSVVIGSPAAKA